MRNILRNIICWILGIKINKVIIYGKSWRKELEVLSTDSKCENSDTWNNLIDERIKDY